MYLTNVLIIGHTRYHTFKLAAATIKSLAVSWMYSFYREMLLQGCLFTVPHKRNVALVRDLPLATREHALETRVVQEKKRARTKSLFESINS